MSNETGQDYEQCTILSRKSEEFVKEMQVESKQIERLNDLAAKLISRGLAGENDIRERHNTVNERWKKLKERSIERKTELENALRVYAFEKSCDELSDNINEKVSKSLNILSVCLFSD